MTGGGFRSPSTIIFSAVRQHPGVLELFLQAVSDQGAVVWVYDDNTDPASSRQLQQADVEILPAVDLPAGGYARSEETHQWTDGAVRRVAAIKNHAIALFLQSRHERLLLVDSDVLLPVGGLAHLEETAVPIVAAIYWTRWHPGTAPLPNAFPITSGLLSDLRNPGHWPVDGLGACTLIGRRVLEQVQFTVVPHLATEGEDRWFCWRCHQAGIPLTACTHIEPFHVYRDSDLASAVEWMRERK